jgi:RimJ/RimL family protein N-acetyltransferase
MIEARVRVPAVDIGYALVRRRWRRGLMSEAVDAVIRWALSQPEIFRVWATCDVENVASARLLEHVGMRREGILRRWIVHPNVSDTPRDCFCYAVVK